MQVSIKYKAVSELQPNGKVEVFFGECLGVVCPALHPPLMSSSSTGAVA